MNPVTTLPGDRIVAYLCTRNMYDLLPAAYNSLLASNPDVHVYCLIEDDALPFKLPDNITCVNVSSQDFFPQDGPNYHSCYSYMVLMKMALPKIFPDADKVLILDVDTIVHSSLSPLWDLDLTGVYFSAVTEPRISKLRNTPYPNAGVMMLNLAYLRETHMDDRIIFDLNHNNYAYCEQDVLSKLCGDKFVTLDPAYNVSRVTTPNGHENPIVSHFASINNYWNYDIVRHWMLASASTPRTVVYIGNRKVYSMMLASAKSLLSHSPVSKIYFLIEDDAFPEPLPSIFRCVNVSSQSIFPPSCPNILPYYSYMTTLRAALTKLLPDEDRVLLLDPDTIVIDDISGIWNYDISDYYFAAVQETRNNDHTPPYYNAGVMLMNLARLRSDGTDDRIISEINTTHYKHLEQDVLNFLCHDHILYLPSHYNASFVSNPCRFPRIMHFLSKAKQFFPEAAKPYEHLDWSEIPFAKERET